MSNAPGRLRLEQEGWRPSNKYFVNREGKKFNVFQKGRIFKKYVYLAPYKNANNKTRYRVQSISSKNVNSSPARYRNNSSRMHVAVLGASASANRAYLENRQNRLNRRN